MEAKKITYVLPCRSRKGKDFIKEITIDFTSQGMRKEYFAIDTDINSIKTLYNDYKLKLAELEAAKLSGADSAECDKIKKESEQIERSIEKLASIDFFLRRYNLIKAILESNGIDDKQLLSFELWNDNVDPDVIGDFLNVAINKDVTSTNVKKKDQESTVTPTAIKND